jgi:hypothetical protein
MELKARIKGISYSPKLCKTLKFFHFYNFENAILDNASFIIQIDENNSMAISQWVTPKRTRSYPYARVYDTLDYGGKKVTIIPIFKDEGKDGDRDYLQWDTISLMNLLGVYVIIGYYVDANKNKNYGNKITKQKFDINYLNEKLMEIKDYKSDALHWNLSQLENIGIIGKMAIDSYNKISKKTSVKMHSEKCARKRIKEIKKGGEKFMNLSRTLARQAQKREMVTEQPKENLDGEKGIITITNYLGGKYYLTLDEVELLDQNKVKLIEGKHSKESRLPSLSDIKDGLIKMVLFSNLDSVSLNDIDLIPIPTLKLTTGEKLKRTKYQERRIKKLKKESEINNFNIIINEVELDHRKNDLDFNQIF